MVVIFATCAIGTEDGGVEACPGFDPEWPSWESVVTPLVEVAFSVGSCEAILHHGWMRHIYKDTLEFAAIVTLAKPFVTGGPVNGAL